MVGGGCSSRGRSRGCVTVLVLTIVIRTVVFVGIIRRVIILIIIVTSFWITIFCCGG